MWINKNMLHFTCNCEGGMCFESEWMVCICVLSCFRLCLWVCVCVWGWFTLNYACMFETGSSSSTSSFLVCASLCLLDMSIWWMDRCPGCGNVTVFMALELCMPDEYYCYNCWDDWFEMKWARTRDCMLMLATKSLQDRQSQKWCAFYNSKKAYGIHCSAWW